MIIYIRQDVYTFVQERKKMTNITDNKIKTRFNTLTTG